VAAIAERLTDATNNGLGENGGVGTGVPGSPCGSGAVERRARELH